MANTPESPPQPPVIPVGLATKLGLAGTILLGLAAALAPLLEGAGAGTSRHFATLSAILASITVIGRMLQSAAALAGAPKMALPTSQYAFTGGSYTYGTAGGGAVNVEWLADDEPDPALEGAEFFDPPVDFDPEHETPDKELPFCAPEDEKPEGEKQ